LTLPDEMTQSDDFEIIPQALEAITFFLKIQILKKLKIL